MKSSFTSVLFLFFGISLFALSYPQGNEQRKPPSFYDRISSSQLNTVELLPKKRSDSIWTKNRKKKSTQKLNSKPDSLLQNSSKPLSPEATPNQNQNPRLSVQLLKEKRLHLPKSFNLTERKDLTAKSIFQTQKEILILNTNKGFIPSKIRLFKNDFYTFYVVNVNEKHHNASFIMSSFSKYHGTYYGKVVSFDLRPHREGLFPFQSPETESEGWLVILPEKSQFFRAQNQSHTNSSRSQ